MVKQEFIDGKLREMTPDEETAFEARTAADRARVESAMGRKPRHEAAIDILVSKGLITEEELADMANRGMTVSRDSTEAL